MESCRNIEANGTVVRAPTITSSSKGVTTMPYVGELWIIDEEIGE